MSREQDDLRAARIMAQAHAEQIATSLQAGQAVLYSRSKQEAVRPNIIILPLSINAHWLTILLILLEIPRGGGNMHSHADAPGSRGVSLWHRPRAWVMTSVRKAKLATAARMHGFAMLGWPEG